MQLCIKFSCIFKLTKSTIENSSLWRSQYWKCIFWFRNASLEIEKFPGIYIIEDTTSLTSPSLFPTQCRIKNWHERRMSNFVLCEYILHKPSIRSKKKCEHVSCISSEEESFEFYLITHTLMLPFCLTLKTTLPDCSTGTRTHGWRHREISWYISDSFPST